MSGCAIRPLTEDDRGHSSPARELGGDDGVCSAVLESPQRTWQDRAAAPGHAQQSSRHAPSALGSRGSWVERAWHQEQERCKPFPGACSEEQACRQSRPSRIRSCWPSRIRSRWRGCCGRSREERVADPAGAHACGAACSGTPSSPQPRACCTPHSPQPRF